MGMDNYSSPSLIQLMKINAQSKCAIPPLFFVFLFFTNNTEAPQGELLGQMKPLSNHFEAGPSVQPIP
jgi:hypothetical protein